MYTYCIVNASEESLHKFSSERAYLGRGGRAFHYPHRAELVFSGKYVLHAPAGGAVVARQPHEKQIPRANGCSYYRTRARARQQHCALGRVREGERERGREKEAQSSSSAASS